LRHRSKKTSKQNIYDNDTFFEGYKQIREKVILIDKDYEADLQHAFEFLRF
jgi:hypothetical protein